MDDQNNVKTPTKLDSYDKQKLGHAYMALYDALVAEFQSKNMTLGKSWYNALSRIHEILKSKKTNTPNVALDYLMNFYNSHRATQQKKMMIAKDKDSTIATDPETSKTAAARVESELKKFDDAVKSVTDGEVLIVLNPVKPMPGKSFYNWAENQPEDVVVDFDDPRSFERAYKKYVLQQKGK